MATVVSFIPSKGSNPGGNDGRGAKCASVWQVESSVESASLFRPMAT